MKKIKYLEISQDMEKDILDNYNSEEQYLSISELKNKYSVSLDTVNKAISVLENKNLIYRIHGKGTFVKKDKSKNYSVLVISSYNVDKLERWEYLREMINGIHEYIFDKHINITINSYSQVEKNIHNIKNIHGIILLSTRSNHLQIAKLLSQKNIPIISITNRLNIENVINIDTNTEEAMEMIVSTLFENGHRKIGFIHNLRNMTNYHDSKRYELYLKNCEKLGLEVMEEWTISKDNDFLSKKTLDPIKYLSQNNGPTAYILCSYEYCQNDFLEKLNKITHSNGKKLSLIGFDMPLWARFSSYHITTIKQDFKGLGHTAISELIKILNNKSNKNDIIISNEFIKGNTVYKIN